MNETEILARTHAGKAWIPLPRQTVTWAPGAVDAVPPVFADWKEIERFVEAAQGNIELLIDQTGLPGFAQVPADANLDGFGRLEIRGVGPNGEAELQIADGGQIRNVQQWRTIVVRADPSIRPPILYSLDGMIVECFDATFLFAAPGVGIQPIIEIAVPSYLGLYFIGSSELRNSHHPGFPVLHVGTGVNLLFAIGLLFFPSSFDTTISGPLGSILELQLDSTVSPTINLPAFLGARTTVQISIAEGVKYTPANPADWVGPPPTKVSEAIDRMAALLNVLNGGPIP